MVGIVFLGDVLLCPYMKKYTDALRAAGEEYEIICWDRERNSNLKSAEGMHIYRRDLERLINPVLKISAFLGFKRFAESVIKNRKYDKLIVFTTMTAVLLYRLLVKKYKKRFIFDYRDASYENLPVFTKILDKIISASAFTSVSSKGFLEFLPKGHDYVISHNFSYSDIERKSSSLVKNTSGVINVGYIGILRESNYLKEMMDEFGGDKRFSLNIHGYANNYEEIAAYAEKYDNVNCGGRYKPEEKAGFLAETDVIMYNYPCMFRYNYALANKYYDGIILKKPLLTNLDTFSGRLVAEKGVGCSVPYGKVKTTDALYDYYMALNPEKFCENAEAALSEVIAEDKSYMSRIAEFIAQPQKQQ